jgi:hypothetical protein
MGDFFLPFQSLSELPMMHIAFWFDAYSITKVFSFSITFGKISGLGEYFVLIIFLQQVPAILFLLTH